MPLPNAPIPLSQVSASASVSVFPSDLLSIGATSSTAGGGVTSSSPTVAPGGVTNANGGFYTQISMVKASDVMSTISGGAAAGGISNPASGSSVYLPLPRKIQDIELAVWNDLSALDYIPIINQFRDMANIAGRAGALGAPQSVNPFMFMLYKQPVFRTFELNWVFSPQNASETQTLSQILTYFKTAALPDYNLSALTLYYPYIALVRLNPNKYLFDLKPCAIEQVGVDYTGTDNGPSFYNDGGPTVLSVTLRLKEIDIWTRTDMVQGGRGGNLVSGMQGAS